MPAAHLIQTLPQRLCAALNAEEHLALHDEVRRLEYDACGELIDEPAPPFAAPAYDETSRVFVHFLQIKAPRAGARGVAAEHERAGRLADEYGQGRRLGV